MLQFQKNTGKTPQALKDKPTLEWYHEVFLKYYYVLSASRSYYLKVIPSPAGPQFQSVPNRIDLLTILEYNKVIDNTVSAQDFISIIQVLDSIYLNWDEEVEDADNTSS